MATKATKKKPTHFVNIGGSRRVYFATLSDARSYIKNHWPMGKNGVVGMYHIYPVDKSGYSSKIDGRVSFGEGNKEWEKSRGKK